MATYEDLYENRSSTDYQALINKIVVAVAIKAEDIASEASPTAEELAWAIKALTNPRGEADAIINFVMAANNTATIAAINGASDSAIQTNVNDAVDTLFGV